MKRPQFSIRGLMILTAAVAALLWWIGKPSFTSRGVFFRSRCCATHCSDCPPGLLHTIGFYEWRDGEYVAQVYVGSWPLPAAVWVGGPNGFGIQLPGNNQ